MQPETDNFIHRYPDALTKKQCEDIIAYFEKNKKNHSSGGIFLDGEHKIDTNYKVSTDISVNVNTARLIPALRTLLDKLDECLVKYLTYYKLFGGSLYHFDFFNIQKYNPSEGFFEWHYEADIYHQTNRQLVWMVYLNDIDMLNDGGGTKFSHQNWVEAATVGKILIWPAYFTHEHKGQISNTKTKYIATGWFNSPTQQPEPQGSESP